MTQPKCRCQNTSLFPIASFDPFSMLPTPPHTIHVNKASMQEAWPAQVGDSNVLPPIIFGIPCKWVLNGEP